MILFGEKIPTIKEKLDAMHEIDVTRPSERTISIPKNIPRHLAASPTQMLVEYGQQLMESELQEKSEHGAAAIKLPHHRVISEEPLFFLLKKVGEEIICQEYLYTVSKGVFYQVPVTYEQECSTKNICPAPFYGKLKNMCQSFGFRYKAKEQEEELLERQILLFDEIMSRPDIPQAAHMLLSFLKAHIADLMETLMQGLLIPDDWEIVKNDKGIEEVLMKSRKKKIPVKNLFCPLFLCELEDGSLVPCFNNKEIAVFWEKYCEEKIQNNEEQVRCQLSGKRGSKIALFPYFPGYTAKISGTSEDYDSFFNPEFYGLPFVSQSASKAEKTAAFQHCFTCTHESANLLTTAADYLHKHAVIHLTNGNIDEELWVFSTKKCSKEKPQLNPSDIQEAAEQYYLKQLLLFSDAEQEKDTEIDKDHKVLQNFRKTFHGFLIKNYNEDDVYCYLSVTVFNKKQVTFSGMGWITFRDFQQNLLQWQQYGNVPILLSYSGRNAGKSSRIVACVPSYKKIILIGQETKGEKPSKATVLYAKKAKGYIEKEVALMLFQPHVPYCISSYMIKLVVEALYQISCEESFYLYYQQLMASASMILKKYKMEEIIVNLDVLVHKNHEKETMSTEELATYQKELEKSVSQTTLSFLCRNDISEREKVSYLYGRMFAVARRIQFIFESSNKGNRADIASKRSSLLNNAQYGWAMIDQSLYLIQQRQPNSYLIKAGLEAVYCLYATIGDSCTKIIELDHPSFLLGEATQEAFYALVRNPRS